MAVTSCMCTRLVSATQHRKNTRKHNLDQWKSLVFCSLLFHWTLARHRQISWKLNVVVTLFPTLSVTGQDSWIFVSFEKSTDGWIWKILEAFAPTEQDWRALDISVQGCVADNSWRLASWGNSVSYDSVSVWNNYLRPLWTAAGQCPLFLSSTTSSFPPWGCKSWRRTVELVTCWKGSREVPGVLCKRSGLC